MVDNVIVRKATVEDFPALLPLVEEFVSSFTLDTAKFSESYTRLLTDTSAAVLVAVSNDDIAGYCLGFVHDTFYANGKVAWLEELMVDTGRRRSGLGEALVLAFEQWARTEGAVLSALATRRAANFYGAIGYEESATYFRRIL